MSDDPVWLEVHSNKVKKQGRFLKKDEYLIRNGASLFKELVKSTHEKNNPFRIFSLKELQKATNIFNADYFSNCCGLDTMPGSLFEGRSITLKTYTVHHHTLVDEVVSLSLIKHRNVVKLLGCCLETEFPIVIHELPHNRALAKNIFHEKYPSKASVELSWTDRLRIATEIADALSYLHSELHMTHGLLYHAEAVLLDEFHSAKLGAFDLSKIQNQAGSSDVETDIRNKLRKRDDVYDFGNILLDLLCIQTDYKSKFTKCKEKVEILKYLKLNVSEKEMPQIEAYIDLSLRCRPSHVQRWNIYYKRMNEVVGEDELSIEEVARELRRIRRMMNLSSGANASSSSNASTSYHEVTSD